MSPEKSLYNPNPTQPPTISSRLPDRPKRSGQETLMAGPAADHQPTASDVEPYKEMLESAAYDRMRKEHTAEYAPASVFFTHDKHSVIDRRNSFRVKAALVHEAITGHHVDDPTLRSNRLLLALANACHSAIHGSSSSQQKDPAAGTRFNYLHFPYPAIKFHPWHILFTVWV